MKKLNNLILYIILISVTKTIAQPTIGFNSFTVPTTTIVAAASTCTAPKVANIMDGWVISISSMGTCGFNIANSAPSTGHINYFITGFANLNYLTFGSSNGGEFAIQEMHISTSSFSCINVPMLYTGYKNGSPIPGATLTANMPGSTFPNTVAVTFTSNPLFNDVDDIRVTTPAYCSGLYQVWDITTATATTSCTSPTLNLTGTNNVLCNGGATGSATVSATGGSPYTYTWSPSGGNAASASGLSAGNYTCVVTNSCGATASQTVNITQPASVLATATVVTNVLCFGNATGAATVTASGGTIPYTYLWSTAQTTSVISGQNAGIRTVTVTDANNCTNIRTVTINQPGSALSTATAVTNVLCFGNSTGSATVSVSGGTSPYTYLWSGAQTTSVTSGQTAGVRTVTVTDANACTTTNTVNITQPASGITTSTAVTNVLCFGNSTGAATVTASGGAGSYTYLWSGAQTTSVTSGQTAGVRTVTVTDANGCTRTNTVTITQPASGITTSTAVTNVLCFGNSTGAATVTASGGAGSYSYLWSTGATTSVITSQASGTKSYTITDANGCNTTGNVIISQPVSALVTATAVTNVLCNGNANGSATITATGGTTAYSYLWSTGANTSVITSQTSGVKTATVTDANGCTSIKSISITQPASAIAASNVVTNVLCFGASTGAINLTPAGGTAPYTFNWGSGITTEDRTGLLAGAYTCTITDNNGCTTTSNATITQPATAVSASNVVTNVLCFGASTGAINLTPAGGTAPYSFNWGGGITTEDRTGLLAGTYNCTVTDNNGCTTTSNATISQPASALAATISSTNTACLSNTGIASVIASGGTPSYSYAWAPSGGTSATANALAAGSYTCTINDANGCSITRSVAVTTASGPSLTSLSQTNVSCNAGSNGAASVNAATGGAGGYTYNWTPGNPTGDGTTSVTGLTAQIYTCTVTDANGCSASQTFNITQPASALATSTAVTNVSCFGNSTGSATITAAGGTAGYSYLWSTVATTSVITSQTSGVKTVTVTDANGCSSIKSVSISQPASALATSTAVANVACFGNSTGSATITVTGGTASYSYLWSTGATTSVITSQASGTKSYTITDANGCNTTGNVIISQPTSALVTATAVTNILCNGNATGSATTTASGGTAAYSYLWSTGATTSVITSQTAGVKTATVTDANGCTSIKSISISQPASALATSTAVTNVACFGNSTGSATITTTGGTASYSYLWSTGATTSVITSQASGTKSYTVTDANGCTSSGNAIISQPSSVLATSTTVTNVLCNGGSNGSATITATGGTATYSFVWSTGATTSVITSQTAGVKTATVTDANGCTSVNSVAILEPTVLTATSSQTNTTCNGVCDGSVIASPNGGTAPYTFVWSPGGLTSASINSLCAGSYSVLITDANGCSLTKTITITEPTAVTISAVSGNILCNGGSTSVTVTANGGTGAYTGTGSFTETAGTYTYTVTDANACSTNTVITITEPTVLNVSLSAAPITCNGSTTQVTFNVSGGAAPYIGNSPVTVSAGSYTYTLTDANNCSVTETITVTQPAAIVASQTITLCSGQSLSIGSNTYTTSGTYIDVLQSQVNGCDSTLTSELTILPAITHTQNVTLCFGEALSVGSNIYNASGTYTDVLTASNGCDSTLTTVLVINSAVDVATSLSGLTISANVSSATYQWIDCDNSNQPIAGETNQSFTASSNGNYAVIVTQTSCSDTSACVNISTVGIEENSDIDSISIYPNPSNGIYIISGISKNTTISIYNGIGELLSSTTASYNTIMIDLSIYRNGIYYIKINNENNGELVRKLIKQQ